MLVRHQVVSLSGSHALATARVCLDHLQLLHHHNLGVSARETLSVAVGFVHSRTSSCRKLGTSVLRMIQSTTEQTNEYEFASRSVADA